jgi:hypothetical protein
LLNTALKTIPTPLKKSHSHAPTDKGQLKQKDVISERYTAVIPRGFIELSRRESFKAYVLLYIYTSVVHSVKTVSHCNETLHDKCEANLITATIFYSIDSLTSIFYSVTLLHFRILLSIKVFFLRNSWPFPR